MPSIGNDLASIRSQKGYSLEDVQKATKIPISTLQSIEDGTIFSDSTEINTYIRSFVRTYARALKLDEELVTRALDQEELGNYNHLLLQNFPDIKKKKGIEIDEPDDEFSSESSRPSGKNEGKKSKEPSSPKIEKRKSKKPAPSKIPSSASSGPDLRNIDWSGVGNAPKSSRTQTPVWLISAGFLVILIVAAAVLISQFDLFSSDDPPPPDPSATEESASEGGQNLSLELTDQIPETQSPAAVLEDTLYLTVYAAYNRLDPVRVWSDLKPRVDPYWLDQGTAFNYEFQDTIYVRGNYSNMLLFLNGNRIDNFREQFFNQTENAVELTRNTFDSEARWATPIPLELPGDVAEPDTVTIRPSN